MPQEKPTTADGCHKSENTYILITQCLQNNFFLADENRLCLPKDVVAQMLIGTGGDHLKKTQVDSPSKEITVNANRREITPELLQSGPLYQFLDAAIYADHEVAKLPRNARDPLHIINIQDWHERGSKNYDEERRLYGLHCEENTWESESIEGFEKFFKPWTLKDGQTAPSNGQPYNDGECNYFYTVHSDSLFDFQPADNSDHAKSTLTAILDKLIKTPQKTDVTTTTDGATATKDGKTYVVVIGVYSDIKIMTLLTGLRSRYHIDNLIVSDILTASITLERHLAGLDYAHKVLGVEVTHSLNELARILNRAHTRTIDITITKNNSDFNDYNTYYLDKQSVLSYQDNVLSDYLDLTEQRAVKIYNWSKRANQILTITGVIFILFTLGAAIVQLIAPDRVSEGTVLIFAGVSLSQFIATFFTRPMGQMQENLNNLVRLRNYLESYSTTTALLRHHLTRPEYLSNPIAPNSPEEIEASLDRLQKQMGIVDKESRHRCAKTSMTSHKAVVKHRKIQQRHNVTYSPHLKAGMLDCRQQQPRVFTDFRCL